MPSELTKLIEQLTRMVHDAWAITHPSPTDLVDDGWDVRPVSSHIKENIASLQVIKFLVSDLSVMTHGRALFGDFALTVYPNKWPVVSFKVGKFEFTCDSGVLAVSSPSLKRLPMYCPLQFNGDITLDVMQYMAIRGYLSYDELLNIRGTDELPPRLMTSING